MRWGLRLVSGGARGAPTVRGLLDTSPLRRLLIEILKPADGVIEEIDANLSLLMFQPDYLQQLIEIGEQNAESCLEEIRELFEQ